MNSECRISGWLHDYRIVKTLPDGVIEVCQRCRDKQYFRNNTPNTVYLSYHNRPALQRQHSRFFKEYAR